MTFVLCIENNRLREQTLLLCESLRRYGGRQKDSRVVAFAPRPGLAVDRETRARLRELAVDYVDEPPNTTCHDYAPANRVFAGAWAEAHLNCEWIAVLDSDTLVLGEIELPTGCDAAVRVVDEKGSATREHGDPFEAYGQRMAGFAGVELDRLLRVHTTITGAPIRASSGDVGPDGSEFWGSTQTALALAIWAATLQVHHLSDRYNVPLHLIAAGDDIDPKWYAERPVHVHYHWMFDGERHEIAQELLARLGVAPEALRWFATRLPLAAA